MRDVDAIFCFSKLALYTRMLAICMFCILTAFTLDTYLVKSDLEKKKLYVMFLFA